MRVSIEKADPAYDFNRPNGQDLAITLDGVTQRCATTADEELGMVRRFVLNEDGTVKVDEATQSYCVEVVHGRVVVVDLRDPTSVHCALEWSQDGARSVEVLVHSKARPNAVARMQMPFPDKARLGDAGFLRWAELSGGACAEHCIQKYGDRFEPDEAARQVKELAREWLSRERQAARAGH